MFFGRPAYVYTTISDMKEWGLGELIGYFVDF